MMETQKKKGLFCLRLVAWTVNTNIKQTWWMVYMYKSGIWLNSQPLFFCDYLWNISWSGENLGEGIFDVSLADEASKHPDPLEHVDAIQNEDENSVLNAVEDQRGCNF